MQSPSHCDSWGQTLPQTAGRLLSTAIILAAPSKLPFATSIINAGIFTDTGHAATHLGFLQLRQRVASSIASSLLYPYDTSSKFVLLILGSCSRTGTLGVLFAIFFVSIFRIGSYRPTPFPACEVFDLRPTCTLLDGALPLRS